jgi:hypothetical protein
MKRHTARSKLQTTAITDLGVLAIENDGNVAICMSMSGQPRIRLPPFAFWFSNIFIHAVLVCPTTATSNRFNIATRCGVKIAE